MALLAAIAMIALAACGAPGEPVPPSPPIPLPVSDLDGKQAGDAVQLTFTMPGKSTRSLRLTEVPTVEILRGSLQPDGSLDSKSLHVVDTIPGAMVKSFTKQGKVVFPDPLWAEEVKLHPGETIVYLVRTYISDKKPSAPSNSINVRVYPVPAAVAALELHTTENAVQLSWKAPALTAAGEAAPAIQEFRVYRGELNPASAEAAGKNASDAVWLTPPILLATTRDTDYQDLGFDYGKTYAYLVRSVVLIDGSPLESSDSPLAIIKPVDNFPPKTPDGLVATVVPGAAQGSKAAELSWSINIESDLAGYRVYRSEQQGTRGELISREILLTPAYRDTSVVSGRQYWYCVTAVDRAGNESATSPQVTVDIP